MPSELTPKSVDKYVAEFHPTSFICQLAADWHRLRAENAAMREQLEPITGNLKYHCGCPAVRSDKIKAFCPEHLACLTSDGDTKHAAD